MKMKAWPAIAFLLTAGVLLSGLFLDGIRFPECFVLKRFGVYCPGCGMTRAVQGFLSGDLVSSFRMHPGFLYIGIGTWILAGLEFAGMDNAVRHAERWFWPLLSGIFLLHMVFLNLKGGF